MAATEMLCRLFGINPLKLSPKDNLILEVELFMRICEKLKEVYIAKNKKYFLLIKTNEGRENAMIETRFLRFIIEDILMTEEYSLEGISYQTQIPEDIICDLISGKNQYPSLDLSRKLIELHQSVRPDLYKEVIKKITAEYLAIA